MLLMLSVVLVIATTAAVGRVSLSEIKLHRIANNSLSMLNAKQALLGYALKETTIGALPCPDTDFPPDGLENLSLGQCFALVGWLPYKTLNVPPLYDASGTLFWYSVGVDFTTSTSISVAQPLTINGSRAVAAVISANQPLPGQPRTTSGIRQYLEGTNSNGDITVFEQALSDTNNDLVLAVVESDYWPVVEQFNLASLASLLSAYKDACGTYPWAANFFASTGDSVDGLFSGSFPMDSASPNDWGEGCATGIEPTQSQKDKWRSQILYSFCAPTNGDCLEVSGNGGQFADAMLVSPGTPLVGQVRTVTTLSAYFEGNNANASTPFSYLPASQHSSLYNDVTYFIDD